MKLTTVDPHTLTTRAKSVFAEAEASAMRRGAPQVTPEDLLIALARCTHGVGREVLTSFSIDLEKHQDALAALAPHEQTIAPRPATVELSPEALRVLALATEEAAALDHRYLGTEHLVLGLLRDETSKAGAFLRARSASAERARKAVRALLYGDDEGT